LCISLYTCTILQYRYALKKISCIFIILVKKVKMQYRDDDYKIVLIFFFYTRYFLYYIYNIRLTLIPVRGIFVKYDFGKLLQECVYRILPRSKISKRGVVYTRVVMIVTRLYKINRLFFLNPILDNRFKKSIFNCITSTAYFDGLKTRFE